ncbi:MAG TPA: choice-of-anchor B family protein, partial [Bacteroidia bacterium]|nr:choice-of-anchor B family protein [Bacteroidia bacterium]
KSNLTYPGKNLANIWGYVDTLGNEYALVGTSAGLSIVNVTNPVAPVEVFTVAGTTSAWREIKTHGKYAYVTTEGGTLGLQIVNLSNLPASISSKYYKGDGAINNLLNKAHALHIDNGYCYLYGTNLFSGAAVILNLNDPWNPVYAGNTSAVGVTSNYIHDGCVFNDTLWGSHIYGGYFSAIDVSNKATPVLLETQNTPTNFTHNTWLSDNHRTLFSTDENSNSYLAAYDVSDVNNITLLDKIQSTPGNGAVIHNTYVHNDYAVSSYYTEGIVVVDAAKPDNLIKVGQYDSSPAYSGSGFNGCWGVYPYLPSGNLIVSDIQTGLHVVTPNYVRGCYLEGKVTSSYNGLPIIGANVTVAGPGLNETTNATGDYKTGTHQSGTYTVTVTKVGYVTKTVSVTLANGVLSLLNVALDLPGIAITGTIKNQYTNAGVANCEILLQSNYNTYTGLTDSNGDLMINNVSPGNYNYACGVWGYKTKCGTILLDGNNNVLNQNLYPGYADDFTFDFNWKTQNSLTTGAWVRQQPVGTTYPVANDANPNTDVNNDCFDKCYITGNGGGAASFDDVDSGYTKLTSPNIDFTVYADPVIQYSRWFFASPGSKDTLIVRLTKGNTTVELERIDINTPGKSAWVDKSFRLLDYMTKGKKIKLSFYVRDKNADHVIECGVDNFMVYENFLPVVSTHKVVTNNNDLIVKAYPNPLTDVLNIKLNQSGAFTFEIRDITGRLIMSNIIDSKSGIYELDCSLLNKGMYLLHISNQNTNAVLNIVKH